MASYLPWLVVSPPAGALVDRYERVRLMWWADLAQGAVVTAIAVLIAVHRHPVRGAGDRRAVRWPSGRQRAVRGWNVVSVSMRQREIPDALLGRGNSICRMLGWGTIPLGALAGGFLADAAGLRAPYIVAGIVRGATLLAMLPALVAASRSRAPA
jgi:hypothetical protein